MSMWKFDTKKRAPDDIVLRLPDPAKATSKEAANTEIVNTLATDKTTMTTKHGVKRKTPITTTHLRSVPKQNKIKIRHLLTQFLYN